MVVLNRAEATGSCNPGWTQDYWMPPSFGSPVRMRASNCANVLRQARSLPPPQRHLHPFADYDGN